MRFRIVCSLGLLVFSVFAAVQINAQGVIVPIRCDIRPCRPPRVEPRPVPIPNVLPVKSIKLDTKIVGQVATTRVEQIFRNDTPYTLEGTYFFPIPEGAAIKEFAIWENGKKLVGEVRSREEARRIYDEIVRRQRDPGLLEYVGKNLLQASIFPIPANSDKKLELVYSQILMADSGTVAYRYPLGTGRNLRLQNQSDVRTPGGQQVFGTVSGSIEIEGNQALRNVYSPSHTIDVKKIGEKKASVSFESKNNDNDFQLFFGLSDDDFGMSLLTFREPNKDGYFLLTLSPKDGLAEKELVNKDIVFVLDTSGSMADEGKMDKAKAALLFGIRTLREGDRFNIINFAGEEHLMEKGLVAADAAGKKRGEAFVNKLTPTGGTNINDSLIASVKQFDKNSRPKMLVFMTDGLATVGETNTDAIIGNLKKTKNVDVRIFPFGFGYDVNTELLDKLGAENSGISDYVQPKEDLEVKVSNFFARVSSPVLADLELDFGPLQTEYTYPRKLTDLFKGMQLTILGRYKNADELRKITVELKGMAGKEIRRIQYKDLAFPLKSDSNDFLPRLWASRRVGWLIEQIRINGETKETRDEVTELGTKFGIVTPYTSYLATDGSFAQMDGLEIARRPRSMPAAKSGESAVKMSVQQNTMQSNVSVVADKDDSTGDEILLRNSATNQFFANKNFVNTNNIWVDTEFIETAKLPEIRLKFASEAYFDLAAKETELAKYFSLGEEVVVVWKNTVYRITK